jgi:hypothetical protein
MKDEHITPISITPASGAADGSEQKLPRRDWILLPMLGLLTICFIGASARLIARQAHLVDEGSMHPCLVFHDLSTGVRGIPGSVCWQKADEESKPVEYRFNSSGYRANEPFGPKPQGTYRIVMTGSSFVMGWDVPVDKTFAGLLPIELSKLTGRKIELYNEGMHTGFPLRVALSFNDVLAVKPDLVVWILSATDIVEVSRLVPESVMPPTGGKGALTSARSGGLISTIKGAFTSQPPLDAVRHVWDESISSFVLRHFLYESQSLYVNSSLMPGNTGIDYLRLSPSAAWQGHLEQFDKYAADIESRARAAGIPLVVVYVPNRAQAAMISMGEWPAAYDPYKLDNDLRSIIVKRGGIYIDVLPGFRTIPNPEQYYFPVDGHPDADGHAIIADLLAKALTDGTIPALRATPRTKPAFEKGN